MSLSAIHSHFQLLNHLYLKAKALPLRTCEKRFTKFAQTSHREKLPGDKDEQCS